MGGKRKKSKLVGQRRTNNRPFQRQINQSATDSSSGDAEVKLSVKTISTYRSRILGKMRMQNSAEKTHYAIKNGLVE